MDDLCIECGKPGKFIVEKVIRNDKEVLVKRTKCNKCRYKQRKEAENLKIELYG